MYKTLITNELIGVKFPEYLFLRIYCARHTCLSVVMHPWLPGKYGLWEHTGGDENAVKWKQQLRQKHWSYKLVFQFSVSLYNCNDINLPNLAYQITTSHEIIINILNGDVFESSLYESGSRKLLRLKKPFTRHSIRICENKYWILIFSCILWPFKEFQRHQLLFIEPVWVNDHSPKKESRGYFS